ncbi:glycoside hydrolase family 76 protein [uncultured Chitinophaga sp.]|uniref:glycoside hydrolase family 76 protein n=1 Tax=uncultured Chitinophaga sp. TaxID=339340 RepID=UPI0025D112F3|nr:glycoside hydrolase family 76 protein [uncultured Chitinophaga sp.]
MKANWSITVILLASLVAGCSKEIDRGYPDKQEPAPVAIDYNFALAADSGQLALDKQFWSATEHYYLQNNGGHTGFNYWWNAHAVDVLVDGYNRTGNAAYITRLDQLLDGMYKKNGNKWVNNFYDDMEWLVISLLRAYDATGTESYKTLAETLWTEIKKGWTGLAGGGIMWEKNSPGSKNACSNGPAIIIAARLYKLNGNADDLEWAKKIYNWQRQYLINPANGTVYDGTGVTNGVITPNTNVSMVLTYNQGTWMGGALELFRVTGNQEYLRNALRTANYVVNDLTKFSPNGVLKGENTGDGGLFKGIFIRYLTRMIVDGNLDEETKNSYLQYMERNGKSLFAKGIRKPEYIFDADWRKQPASATLDCSVQLSGVMLFEALCELEKKGMIKK